MRGDLLAFRTETVRFGSRITAHYLLVNCEVDIEEDRERAHRASKSHTPHTPTNTWVFPHTTNPPPASHTSLRTAVSGYGEGLLVPRELKGALDHGYRARAIANVRIGYLFAAKSS